MVGGRGGRGFDNIIEEKTEDKMKFLSNWEEWGGSFPGKIEIGSYSFSILYYRSDFRFRLYMFWNESISSSKKKWLIWYIILLIVQNQQFKEC